MDVRLTLRKKRGADSLAVRVESGRLSFKTPLEQLTTLRGFCRFCQFEDWGFFGLLDR